MPIYVNVDSPTNNCPGSEKQHGLINKKNLMAPYKSHKCLLKQNYRYVSLHSINSFIFWCFHIKAKVFSSAFFSFVVLWFLPAVLELLASEQDIRHGNVVAACQARCCRRSTSNALQLGGKGFIWGCIQSNQQSYIHHSKYDMIDRNLLVCSV